MPHSELLATYVYPSHCAATVNEDYLDVDVNFTFIFGPNVTGNNRECILVPLLDDSLLEGNETFDILITPSTEDEEVLSITDPVITVTIQEDSVDCKSVFKSECTYSCNNWPYISNSISNYYVYYLIGEE